jgi:O-antigen ligase
LIAVAVGLIWRPGRGEGIPWTRRRKIAVGVASIAALLVIVTGVVIAWPMMPERIRTLGSGTLRVGIWKSSLHMLADHPIFGVGPDQFLNQFQAHYMTPDLKQEEFTAHPHNLFLDYWLSLGIMGVPILIWLLWRYFREALGKARRAVLARTRDPVGRALALGLLASMLDFLLHGLVDNSYFLMDLAMIFWLSCGLLQLERQVEVGRR